MPLPSPDRLAHHEAGHAVVQHWVARGRYRVTRVSLDSDGGELAGSSQIDNEVTLGLYEFGLVVLAGIAAENRYLSEISPPEGEQLGAVGDIDEWLAQAADVLHSKARVDIVTGNVMRRLMNFFGERANWGRVTSLAKLLQAEGSVEGERLRKILEQQPYTP